MPDTMRALKRKGQIVYDKSYRSADRFVPGDGCQDEQVLVVRLWNAKLLAPQIRDERKIGYFLFLAVLENFDLFGSQVFYNRPLLVRHGNVELDKGRRYLYYVRLIRRERR